MRARHLLLSALFVLGVFVPGAGAIALPLQEYPRDVERVLSNARVQRWRALVERIRYLPEDQKIERTNAFFNSEIRFANDSYVWGLTDYWATPVETLISGMGDCEDYALAKYFTLYEVGISPSRLRLFYVIARELPGSPAHMVLGVQYGKDFKVLDNLINPVRSLQDRTDLDPVFGFDRSDIWLRLTGSLYPNASTTISMWASVWTRMDADVFRVQLTAADERPRASLLSMKME